MSNAPDHFRYRTRLDEDGVHIVCDRYVVIGETEHFYYAVRHDLEYLARHSPAWAKANRKRVSKTSGKRYCYPDKRDALGSFRKRQMYRMSHAKTAMSQAQLSLAQLDTMLDAEQIPDFHPCGHDDHTSSFVWE
ncbi:MAG: hypothetical protein CMK74_02025 [Pseudomonadales bacterium]|nr:hypothetical protein [Pseudomonadales bacterium]|tara:strand:+ start:733 stop:1134 length:402 start_codon:yes stop_codon:yes gene_type:complete